MDLSFDFDLESEYIMGLLIGIVVLIFIILLAGHFISWYVTTASNHTAMICIGRGVC